jgi:hypothetical protein
MVKAEGLCVGGATIEVVRRLGFCVGENEIRTPLYTPEAGERRGTRGITIILLAEVGGRRAAGEASLLM